MEPGEQFWGLPPGGSAFGAGDGALSPAEREHDRLRAALFSVYSHTELAHEKALVPNRPLPAVMQPLPLDTALARIQSSSSPHRDIAVRRARSWVLAQP